MLKAMSARRRVLISKVGGTPVVSPAVVAVTATTSPNTIYIRAPEAHSNRNENSMTSAHADISKGFSALASELAELTSAAGMQDILQRSDTCLDAPASVPGVPADVDNLDAGASGSVSMYSHDRPSAGGSNPFEDILSAIKAMEVSKVGMVHGAIGAGPAGGLPGYSEGEDSPGAADAVAQGMGGEHKPSSANIFPQHDNSAVGVYPSSPDGEMGIRTAQPMGDEWGMELRVGDDMGSMARMQVSHGSGGLSEGDSMSKAKSERAARDRLADKPPQRPVTFENSQFLRREYAAQRHNAQIDKSVRLVFGKNGQVEQVTAPAKMLEWVESDNDAQIAKSFQSSGVTHAQNNYSAHSEITRKHSCGVCGANRPAFLTVCPNCGR